MELNKHLPELPEWPPIRFLKERNEYIVGGPNLSYPRYDMARKTIGSLVFFGLILSLILGVNVSPALGVILAVFCFALLLAVAVFPLMKFLCELIFSGNDQVRFTSSQIIVNGKKYESAPDIPVQFRAQRTPLSDKQIQRNNELAQKGKLPQSRAYDFKFRKVEMIYGSRIVDITSVADEDRAAQFAVALQHGYEMARAQAFNAAPITPARSAPQEDLLPE